MAPDLSGVLVPAATPFTGPEGRVDPGAFGENVERWLAARVAGVVVGGSTGEAVLLDEEERLALWDRAREVVPRDRLMVAGTGLESTRATIRLSRAAGERGADAVLVQPPAFYKSQMTPEVVRDHYLAVADASPVPVIVYQVPLRFSTLDLPSGLVGELSEHENIVGMKDSRPRLEGMAEVIRACRDDFQVLVGSGNQLYASLEVGAVGGILGVANLLPDECRALVEAFRVGRSREAGRLQERIAPVHKTVVGEFGVPGVKAALDLLGYRAGPPRPPLRPLGSGDREEARRLLEEAGVL